MNQSWKNITKPYRFGLDCVMLDILNTNFYDLNHRSNRDYDIHYLSRNGIFHQKRKKFLLWQYIIFMCAITIDLEYRKGPQHIKSLVTKIWQLSISHQRPLRKLSIIKLKLLVVLPGCFWEEERKCTSKILLDSFVK